MLKKVLAGAGCLVVLALCAAPILAQEAQLTPEEEKAAQELAATRKHAEESKSKYLVGLALGLGMGIAALGGAFGQSRAIAAAVDAVARQPEAGGRIQTMMIIGLALIETLVIYMLLVCFLWMPAA